MEDTWPFAPHPRSTNNNAKPGERHSPLGSCAQHHPARGWHSVPKGPEAPRRRIRRTRRTTETRKHGVPLKPASLDVQSCLPSGARRTRGEAQPHPGVALSTTPRGGGTRYQRGQRPLRRTKENIKCEASPQVRSSGPPKLQTIGFRRKRFAGSKLCLPAEGVKHI